MKAAGGAADGGGEAHLSSARGGRVIPVHIMARSLSTSPTSLSKWLGRAKPGGWATPGSVMTARLLAEINESVAAYLAGVAMGLDEVLHEPDQKREPEAVVAQPETVVAQPVVLPSGLLGSNIRAASSFPPWRSSVPCRTS